MSQSKTTQTKKKSASKAPSKPSTTEKIAATTRSSTKISQESQAATDSAVVDIGTERDAQTMLTTADMTEPSLQPLAHENDALYEGTKTDAQQSKDAEPPSTPQTTPSCVELVKGNADPHALAADDEMADAADELFQDVASLPLSHEQIEPSKRGAANTDIVACSGVVPDDIESAAPPVRKAKRLEHHLKSVSPRYVQACAEVSRLRKEFISSLDSKAAHLGVQRSGEAVPVRSAELDAINTDIRETRQKLDALLERKRQLKGVSVELETLNTRVREINRQRQAARLEKKAAFEEMMATQSAIEHDSLGAEQTARSSHPFSD